MTNSNEVKTTFFINTEPMNACRGNVKCPKCEESYYQELYSSRTCVYYPPIYKDGVNINPDRNTTTTNCRCINCGEYFSYQNLGFKEAKVMSNVAKLIENDYGTYTEDVFALINNFVDKHGDIALSCAGKWLYQDDRGQVDALELVANILEVLSPLAEEEDED